MVKEIKRDFYLEQLIKREGKDYRNNYYEIY